MRTLSTFKFLALLLLFGCKVADADADVSLAQLQANKIDEQSSQVGSNQIGQAKSSTDVAGGSGSASKYGPLAKTLMTNPPQYCPKESDLRKSGLWWTALNGSWRSYTQSFAKEIDSFIGAQWVGVKVGKVICIYRGKGGMDFPLALEQIYVAAVLEPTGVVWGPLTQGYKFCKSTNVADCLFFTRPKETVTEIYEQIKYKGSSGETEE